MFVCAWVYVRACLGACMLSIVCMRVCVFCVIACESADMYADDRAGEIVPALYHCLATIVC